MPTEPSQYLSAEELEIRARANRAFRGLWLFTHHDHPIADTGDSDHCDSITGDDGCQLVADIWHGDNYSCQNAEFIAHAREDIPALLAAIDELTNQRDKVLALHHACEPYTDEQRLDPCACCNEPWPCETVRALTKAVQ